MEFLKIALCVVLFAAVALGHGIYECTDPPEGQEPWKTLATFQIDLFGIGLNGYANVTWPKEQTFVEGYIKCIRATDVTGSGGHAVITSGGIGRPFVHIKIYPQTVTDFNYKISFDINIKGIIIQE